MASSLGEIIQRLRRLKALSQEDLAYQAGVRVKTLRALEKGSQRPHAATIKKIAKALGLAPEELSVSGGSDLPVDFGSDPRNNRSWPKRLLICQTSSIALYALSRLLMSTLEAADLRSLVLPTGRTAALVFEHLLNGVGVDLSLLSDTHLFIDTETFGVSPEHPTSRHRFVRERFIAKLRCRELTMPEANVHFFSGYLCGRDIFAEHDALLQRYRPVTHILAYSPDGEVIGYGPQELAEATGRYSDGCRVIHICESERRYIDPHQPSRAVVTIGLGNALAAQHIILPVLHRSKAAVLAKILIGQVDHSCPATLVRLHHAVTIVTTQEIIKTMNGVAQSVLTCNAEVDDWMAGEGWL